MISDKISEVPYVLNSMKLNTKKYRTMEIEGITGLKNISPAFEDSSNESEIELLIKYLNKKYDFSAYYDVYDFIVNVIKFSINALEVIDANYEEFYDNMIIEEALEVILTKLLVTTTNVNSKNGFPSMFNFNRSQINTQQIYNNKKWYPYSQGKYNINYSELLSKITNGILLNREDRIYFHGTSWRHAISIMNKVPSSAFKNAIKPRQYCTDFGLRNFYLTDTFETACLWSARNRQPAVVIFVISDNYINSLENHLKLSGDEWKEVVFKIRNAPNPDNNPNYEIEEQIYDEFINEIDSKDLISGPIFLNTTASSIEKVKYIKYGKYIPYQYSFKDTTINDLNRMLAITLFFESD